MAFYRCKMCGGTVEFEQGSSVGICDSCGTKQTLPRLDDDKKANLYDRADHFRRNSDFDKAMSIYEQILDEDSTDAESYWSIVLCRYGIEYVEDPATHKQIPTVNRTQYVSVLDDEDFLASLRYADEYQREIYQAEATAINEIQKGILDIAGKEAPFDIFICYKEADPNGRRTPDSVLAAELYQELTKEGFKVFFSRVTLEDKLGEEYEPYIFAALNSARVMVVLGTKPEYFQAVWVKNEWSRYLALIRNGAQKVLIPAYRDMDPYELPDAFSHLQAQDMSKLGFMQDLVRGIRKIVGGGTAEQGKKKSSSPVSSGVAGNLSVLMKRGYMALEDGEWQNADAFFENVLNQDAENAEAYLGKLMAELRVHTRDELKNCRQSFENNRNCQKALRFAGPALADALRRTIAAIHERNETNSLAEIYGNAVNTMQTADSEELYRSAARLFGAIPGYLDADGQKERCERKAEECRIAAKKAAKKRKWILVGIATLLLVGIAVWTVWVTVLLPKRKQQQATELLAAGDYDAAYALLEEMGNEDAIAASKYDRAVALMDEKKYEAAMEIFAGLEYGDAAQKAEDCRFFLQKAALADLKAGDNVKFGYYEQNNKTSDGMEEIEWIVLETEGDRALLLSKYALDSQKYNASYASVTWESCSLRKWLNGKFFETAFSQKHRELILMSTVPAAGNPDYPKVPATQTEDRVFLLGISEAQKYFGTDVERACRPTAYCYALGGYDAGGNCSWSLRSPGYDPGYFAYVDWEGWINTYGSDVDRKYNAIRPAMWIDLRK